MGSTIVDFEGEYAATHTSAHAPSNDSTHTSHVAHSPKRERLHSGSPQSTSFLCYDLNSFSPALQVTMQFVKLSGFKSRLLSTLALGS